MIKIICIGKLKKNYLKELCDDYQLRISKYHKIEIIELKDGKMEDETKSILKIFKESDYNIVMAIEGNKKDSLSFAKLIDEKFNKYGTITFIIGASNGISNIIKEKADLLLSFSDNTFPHGLFRGILLEQIYRAFKINNNELYHK